VKVAIVIPCRNDQQFLSECLDSILQQTVKPHAVIIVDDGSDLPIQRSDFPKIEKNNFPVFLIRNEKSIGIAASRNLGVALCGADWFIPLDSDDKLDPKAIQTLREIYIQNPRVKIIQCGVRTFGKGLSVQDLQKPMPMNQSVLMEHCPSHHTGLIQVEAWSMLGGYIAIGDATHRGYEDWDFWIRSSFTFHKYEIYQTIAPLLLYRVRENSQLSTQDRNAAKLEFYIKYRHKWNCLELASKALKELRQIWKVQKLDLTTN
jgi:glycosyltransferase involved in cell wall biosynthesis